MSASLGFIEKFADIHPLPHIVSTISRLIADNTSTMKDIEEAIKMDPVLDQLRKKITIQKNQFNRKFQVMDTKHQGMLEEAQRSYTIIQEQQENCSRTLKSEIAIQTRNSAWRRG